MQDEFKFSCFSVDSIRLMSEPINVPHLSTEVATVVSQDATHRLKQIITRASKFMRHSNRTQLTCADINKALKWSDSQPVFGHECKSNQKLQYSYSTEAQVFKYDDEIINLSHKSDYRLKINSLLTDEVLCEAVPALTIEHYDTIHPEEVKNFCELDNHIV